MALACARSPTVSMTTSIPAISPNGDIAFVSTRKGQPLQCSRQYSETTRFSALPDSYVRCGGDNWRPVPVFTLHAMDCQGTNLRPLSAFENFEWAPSVANDGRLLFTRWDYIDRFNGHFFSLWSANPDGTNPQLVLRQLHRQTPGGHRGALHPPAQRSWFLPPQPTIPTREEPSACSTARVAPRRKRRSRVLRRTSVFRRPKAGPTTISPTRGHCLRSFSSLGGLMPSCHRIDS